MGHMDVWNVQTYGGIWTYGGLIDVHACQLHLKEYVRSFLSLDYRPCSSPKYRT